MRKVAHNGKLLFQKAGNSKSDWLLLRMFLLHERNGSKIRTRMLEFEESMCLPHPNSSVRQVSSWQWNASQGLRRVFLVVFLPLFSRNDPTSIFSHITRPYNKRKLYFADAIYDVALESEEMKLETQQFISYFLIL